MIKLSNNCVSLLESTILRMSYVLGQSFNRLNVCPTASWNPQAVTFANNSTIGTDITTVFVTTSNTVFLASQSLNQIFIWLDGQNVLSGTFSNNFSEPHGLFVTDTGDAYIDDGSQHGRVEKWIRNATTSVTFMNVSSTCFTLFVDSSNTLYCSTGYTNTVIKIALNSSVGTGIIIAGNGTAGLAPNMLNVPVGMFVDAAFNLYVSDCHNHRIQFFRYGQSNATTVAGNGTAGTITLSYPHAITLDIKGYLYIVDLNNHRIVGSGPNGFRCIVGCSGIAGSANDQLSNPWSFSFDSDGNMFVSDRGNSRVQKFLLSSNSCSKCFTSEKRSDFFGSLVKKFAAFGQEHEVLLI